MKYKDTGEPVCLSIANRITADNVCKVLTALRRFVLAFTSGTACCSAPDNWTNRRAHHRTGISGWPRYRIAAPAVAQTPTGPSTMTGRLELRSPAQRLESMPCKAPTIRSSPAAQPEIVNQMDRVYWVSIFIIAIKTFE